MDGAAGIRAGRAYVEIGADRTPLAAGLRRAAAQVKAWGQSMQAVGMGLAKAGGVLGLGVGFGAKMFMDFESWMARTKVLAKPTAEGLAALNEEALRLGRDTIFTATDAAKTMAIFAQAGLKTNEILKATGPTLDLAAAGMLDMATAADISLKVMKGMGIPVSQLGAAVDVMAAAVATANTDLVMLGDAFKYVGPVAKAAGMSLAETTAVIQLLSDAGIQGDMAGTTLRGMLMQLTAPSQEAQAELDRLGVKAIDPLTGKFRGVTAVIADMEAALKGVGSGARLKSLGTVFSARQGAGAAELVSVGAERLSRAVAALSNVSGRAAEISAAQLDTLAGSWKILTSSLEGVVISVGKGVAPLLRQWGEALTGATNAVNKMVEKNPELFKTLAKVSAGLVLGGVALVTFGALVSSVGAVVGGAAAALGAFGAVLKAGVILYTRQWFIALRQSTWLLVLPGALDATTSAWARFTAALKAAGASALDLFRSMGREATVAFEGIRDAMAVGDLQQAAAVGWLGIRIIWLQGVNHVKGVWDGFTGWVGDRFADGVLTLRLAWIEFTAAMVGDWEGGLDEVAAAWDFHVGIVVGMWQTAGSAINAVIDTIKDNLMGLAAVAAVAAAPLALLAAPGLAAGAAAYYGGSAAAEAIGPSVYGPNPFDEQRRRRRQQAEDDAFDEWAGAANDQTFAAVERDRQLRAMQDQLRQAAARPKAQRDLAQAGEDWKKAGQAVLGYFGLGGGDLAKRAEDATRGLTAMKSESAGTFSPWAIQGLGAKSVAERAAAAAEETAKNTKKLVEQGGAIKVI